MGWKLVYKLTFELRSTTPWGSSMRRRGGPLISSLSRDLLVPLGCLFYFEQLLAKLFISLNIYGLVFLVYF